ncbi:MAG TPA: PQQ-binding-like beta-propeller repeat protein [Verrucomicrobiae bacterium]|nr:PQQ-binding-like beta-propeller repeat protein [Verrucomicrobiae bacterium]
MTTRRTRLLLAALTVATPALLHAENWPTWRGPRGDGTSSEKNVPIHWSATSNSLWKAELPGIGHASPIIWGDRIFTVTALTDSQDRVLLCLDRQRGAILWKRTIIHSPLERKHSLNSYASSTPVTDGQQVYTAFLDQNEMVVAAYDFAGNRKWQVRPGPFASVHGFCSSPVLFGDKVIVNGDHDGDSYLVALDRETGKTLWKTPRQNKTRSYCAPLVRELGGRTQVVLSGDKSVASYDPNDGKLHWIIDGPTDQFVASPVYSPKVDLLFITGGYPDHHILAIKPDGRGNVTKTHIVWRTNKGVAYVPSPIIEGDYFLIVSDSGVAHCFEAATGKLFWQERMGEHHASLVSANGLVYFLNDDGVTRVVKPGPDFQLIAQNEIGEKCFASPAISEGQLFLRGEQSLFCVGRVSDRVATIR